MTSVQIASTLSLSGTTAAVMNTPANKATFTESVEGGIAQQSGRKVTVINVVATDVGGAGRRQLLASGVDMAFTVVMPTPPGGDDQATFDSVVADLSGAASSGGALATGPLSSLATVDTAAFVPPTISDAVTVDGSSSCTGANVIFDAQQECRCEDWCGWGEGGGGRGGGRGKSGPGGAGSIIV